MNNYFKIASILCVLVSLFSCDLSNDEDVKKMGVTVSKYTYAREAAPGKISFINTSESADAFLWDFGDNTTSTLKDPVKTYKKTGNYEVILTATNSKTGVSTSFKSTISLFIFEGGLVINGDFEAGVSPWTLGISSPLPSGLLVTTSANTYVSINVTAAGNPFDVNISQIGLNLTQGTSYRLTFDAWSNVNRSMIAGIGLSGAPFTNQAVTRNLTTTRQSFSIDLAANFTSTNSRVIFDLGAATGVVNIDNVTLNRIP